MIIRNDFNPQCITYGQMSMILNARFYYRRLLNLTRSYLRNRYYKIGAEDIMFDRLYLETLGLSNLLHLNLGRAFSDQYGQLLSQFVIYFRDLISAQIAGDTEGINQNLQNLYNNIDTQTNSLASANPFWSANEYRNLFGSYLQGLIKEANAYASGNFNEDIALYDSLTDLTEKMGDTFGEGINNFIINGANIPAQESGPCITYEQMQIIQNISTFWFDLEVWMRSYMLSKYLKIGDVEANYNQLKKVIVDYTNEIKSIYGEEYAANLLQLLNEYLDLFVNYTTAYMAGNTDEVNRIIPLLYQNTASRAALQGSANKFLSEEEWRNRLNAMQVQGMINESTARLSGDVARSFDIYMDLLTQAESMANYFELALFNYFTQAQKGQ
jgi:hypothetical protein